jgi:hypothetical protein
VVSFAFEAPMYCIPNVDFQFCQTVVTVRASWRLAPGGRRYHGSFCFWSDERSTFRYELL